MSSFLSDDFDRGGLLSLLAHNIACRLPCAACLTSMVTIANYNVLRIRESSALPIIGSLCPADDYTLVLIGQVFESQREILDLQMIFLEGPLVG